MQGNLPPPTAPTTVSRLRSLRLDYGWIVIIVLPLLILVLNDKWIYTPVGFIDAWMYHGYFNQLPDLLRATPEAYFGTRLSWIIPGFIIYRLFPPFIANFVLHLGYYYIALGSFYITLKLLFNKNVALLTTIAMGSYSYFLFSIGWDNPDGGALTYILITILLLTLAAKFRYWKIVLFAAGMGYAASIFTNLFLVTFLPIFAGFYYFCNAQNRKNRLTTSLLFFIGGAIVLTLSLCLFNYSINRYFFVFLPSIAFTASKSRDEYYLPSFDWLLQASWLALPAVLFVFGSISLLIKRASTPYRYLKLQFVLIFTTYLTLYLFRIVAIPVLQFAPYVTYIIPFMFLCLAVLLSDHLKIQDAQQVIRLAIIDCLLMLSSFFLARLAENYLYIWGGLSIIPALLFGVFTFTVLLRPPTPNQMVILFFTGLCLMNTFLYPTNPILFTESGSSDKFSAILDGFDAMNAVAPTSQLYVWYQLEEPLSKLYASLASPQLALYAGGIPMVSDNFPSLASHRMGLKHLVNGRRIAILTIDSNALEKANETLEQVGYKPKFLSRKSVVRGDIRYEIIFIELAV